MTKLGVDPWTDAGPSARRDQRASRRRGVTVRSVIVAVLGIIALLGLTPAPADADQTIRFDGAGSAPHVSLIGDSTLTAVRWYEDYGALRQFNFVFNAESCRRTIEQSCISREGFRSRNVLATMQSLDGELGRVLVVMSGYNDPVWTIDEAIEGIVDEARRQDVEHVVWLTLRTSSDVDYSDPQEYSSINTFREYNAQLIEAAAASDGFLQIADWASYSNGASSWFDGDGVHLSPRGVDAVTTFIAGILGRVIAGENVSPAAAPWTVLVPGAEGADVEAVQAALLNAGVDVPGGADGVYGNDTMTAVAAYQREHDGLQVTGAVDIATARMLGVVDDPNAPTTTVAPETTVVPTTDAPTSTVAPAVVDQQLANLAPSPESDEPDTGRGAALWALVSFGALVVVLAGAVAIRRRQVVARRAERRWARVHAATSPGHSVADDRRRADVAETVAPRPSMYDHEVEDGDDEPVSPNTDAGATS